MSRKMAFILIVHGIVLAALGYAAFRTSADGRNVALLTGAIGGLVSVAAGLMAILGMKRRAWAIVANAGVIVVLLNETVRAWLTFGGGEPISMGARVAVTCMFLASIAATIYLLHGERSPDFYRTGGRPER